MISELQIKNFRSIINDNISLEPLTVFIGANGSGKSNLVKALEFLSDLPRFGLNLAVSRHGGRESVVPKSLSGAEVVKSTTEFNYKVCLPAPLSEENIGPDSVDVVHKFSLQFPSLRKVKVLREYIEFDKILYIGHVLRDPKTAPQVKPGSPEHPDSRSSFWLYNEHGSIKFKMDPEFSEETRQSLLAWLGFEPFEEMITDQKKFQEIVGQFSTRMLDRYKRRGKNFVGGLFVDPDMPTILDLSANFEMFRQHNMSIRRYDLLLNELRQEQPPSESARLSKTGENLPAAFRALEANKDGIRRLRATFEAIAPHISGLKVSSLRTSKEFVEFMESKSGRRVESWESSDGSLRALAIMVALESAEKNTAIIIEEPEQNLHPWAIRILIDHMREVAKKNSIQLIITTHSEHVLERSYPEEVRVVTRSEEEGTKFKRIEQIISKEKVEMGEVGKLWVKGILGGVPTVL